MFFRIVFIIIMCKNFMFSSIPNGAPKFRGSQTINLAFLFYEMLVQIEDSYCEAVASYFGSVFFLKCINFTNSVTARLSSTVKFIILKSANHCYL